LSENKRLPTANHIVRCDRRSMLVGAAVLGGFLMTGHSRSAEKNVDFAIERYDGVKDRHGFLLVHSDAGNKEQFALMFQHMKKANMSVLSFDRRGHGQSSMPKDGKFGYVAEADDIFEIADGAGFDRFVLIGHSGGADVAFEAANDRPERIVGLFLVDPAPDPAVLPAKQKKETLEGLRRDYKRFIGEYYRSMAGPDVAIADQIVAMAQATPPETIIGINEELDAFNPHEHAGRFKGPAHSVIQPEYDVEGALHRIQPSMTHEAIGGAGHWIHMVAPGKVEAALDRFLGRLK
jgi:pimeloyl-ACP methyl ester carboxylesterase